MRVKDLRTLWPFLVTFGVADQTAGQLREARRAGLRLDQGLELER